MSDDAHNNFANEFIASWQENYAKAVQDPEIMLQISKAMGFMQQYYEKPFTNSAPASPEYGVDQPDRQQLLRRIEELEARIARLEKTGSGNSRKKKTT